MDNSTTSPAHTKLPWFLDGPFNIAIDDDLWVQGMMVMSGDANSSDSFPIARITGPAYLGREDRCDSELFANAAFIVRACNSNQKLIAACKSASIAFAERLDALEDERDWRSEDEYEDMVANYVYLKREVDAAVAKAEVRNAPHSSE
jgi:hypothetical protein